MKTFALSIAGVPIRMELQEEVPMTDAFRPFLTEAEPVYTGRFRRVETLPGFDPAVLYTGNCYRVHPGGVRSFFDVQMGPQSYAVSRTDYEAGTVQVQYLSEGEHCVSQMDNSFFHLGFEGLLIRQDRVCFHAACVSTDQGGILFSGPSGIGKSTQAQLWCDHRGAKLLNGDRPILQRTEQGFLAWGSPYAGSSKCHVNEAVPVSALVFLAQEPENRIRRLKPSEAFRRIYAGLTMYTWDREFMNRAVDLALELASTVPCLEFGCLPDETAVEFLEGQLKEVGL
jgi:hypothetical protein